MFKVYIRVRSRRGFPSFSPAIETEAAVCSSGLASTKHFSVQLLELLQLNLFSSISLIVEYIFSEPVNGHLLS